MIFGILKADFVVQVGDKIRLDGTSSFISPDESAITSVRIRPSDEESFMDVTTNKYLDWVYSSDGEVTATLEIKSDGQAVTFTKTVTVLTEAEDKLFSNDNDILQHESDIMRFLPKGYSSFNHVHRSAQSIILDSLIQRGIYKSLNVPLTKENIYNILEVKHWSKYLVLQIIYSNVQNAVDDVFGQKASQYRELSERSAQRAFVTLDTDADGSPDVSVDLRAGRLVRR